MCVMCLKTWLLGSGESIVVNFIIILSKKSKGPLWFKLIWNRFYLLSKAELDLGKFAQFLSFLRSFLYRNCNNIVIATNSQYFYIFLSPLTF